MHAPLKMIRIRTFNVIDPAGIALFSKECEVGEHVEDPHGILVRSANVDTDDYPHLLAVARSGAGVDNITVDKATTRGIPVFNAPGANANSVKELFFTLATLGARNILAAIEFVRNIDPELDDSAINDLVEKGKKPFAGFELSEKKIGIVGLGNIGRLVAGEALDKGMGVIGFDPALSDNQWLGELDPGIVRCAQLSELCRESDIVSVHVNLTEKTKGLVDAEFISNMRPGATLVNLARQPICNEAAVLDALDTGQLGMFITDFPTKRTLGHSNIIMTPHLGASTEEAERRSAVMAGQELSDYLKYGIVTNSVNFPNLGEMPRAGIRMRLAIPHKNVPGQLALIMDVLAKADVNIGPQQNDTKGSIGYCIIDLERPIGDDQVSAIKNGHENIIAVHAFRF